MMTVTITSADGNHTIRMDGSKKPDTPGLVVTDLEDWYSQPEIKEDMLPKFRGQGDTPRNEYYRAGKSFTISGWHSSASRAQSRTAKDHLLGFSWYDPVKITVTDGEQMTWREAEATITIEDDHGIRNQGRWWFNIHCKSASPFRYGLWRAMDSLATVEWGAGLEFPLFDNSDTLVFGTDTKTKSSLYNAGTAPAYPVFTVGGNMPSGFRIVIGNRVVEYQDPTDSRMPVTIDMQGHAVVGGAWRQDALVRREWTAVGPGQTINPVLEARNNDGTGWMTGSIIDTYF